MRCPERPPRALSPSRQRIGEENQDSVGGSDRGQPVPSCLGAPWTKPRAAETQKAGCSRGAGEGLSAPSPRLLCLPCHPSPDPDKARMRGNGGDGRGRGSCPHRGMAAFLWDHGCQEHPLPPSASCLHLGSGSGGRGGHRGENAPDFRPGDGDREPWHEEVPEGLQGEATWD